MKSRLQLFIVLLLASSVFGSAAESGADLFATHCASCHGPDGKAHTPAGRKVRAKDLTESKLPDAELVRQISVGTKDSRGMIRMPAFKDKLAPSEIASLVDYVKLLRR